MDVGKMFLIILVIILVWLLCGFIGFLIEAKREWLQENESNMSYDQHIGLKLCLEINEMLYET